MLLLLLMLLPLAMLLPQLPSLHVPVLLLLTLLLLLLPLPPVCALFSTCGAPAPPTCCSGLSCSCCCCCCCCCCWVSPLELPSHTKQVSAEIERPACSSHNAHSGGPAAPLFAALLLLAAVNLLLWLLQLPNVSWAQRNCIADGEGEGRMWVIGGALRRWGGV